MAFVTFEEAKEYLGVHSDELVKNILAESENVCMRATEITREQWDNLSECSDDSPDVIVLGDRMMEKQDAFQVKCVLTVCVLFAMGYLLGNGWEEKHDELELSIKSLLKTPRLWDGIKEQYHK